MAFNPNHTRTPGRRSSSVAVAVVTAATRSRPAASCTCTTGPSWFDPGHDGLEVVADRGGKGLALTSRSSGRITAWAAPSRSATT